MQPFRPGHFSPVASQFYKRTWCLFAFLLIKAGLFGQGFTPDPDWRFENFDSQNHFISREVDNVTMDKRGYIWTSSRGVQRFDGYRTIDFNSFDPNNGGLKDNSANIIADNNGRVWATSAGLCYYEDAAGKFVYVKDDSGHNIDGINGYCCVQKNFLWFVCNRGLANIDVNTLKISFTSLTGIGNPLCIYLIDDNTLLVSSRERVYTYDIRKHTYNTNKLVYNHSLLKIFAIARGAGDVFVGTDHGLFTLKSLKGFSVVKTGADDVLIGDMLFLTGDPEKKYLFLATEGKGMMVYNTRSQKIEFTYSHDNNNLYSLANNIVSKLYCDKQGRLWVATDSGISLLDRSNQQLKMRFLDKNSPDETSVDKVVRDKFDSTKVWMSCYYYGVICVDWKTKKVEKVYRSSLEMLTLLDMVQISRTRWLLAAKKKIIVWDSQSGILSQQKLPVPDSLDLVYGIRALITTDFTTCFITTNIGLFSYDIVTGHIDRVTESAPTAQKESNVKYDLLNGFYEKGLLWIASRNGLFNYDLNRHTAVVYGGKGRPMDYFYFDAVNSTGNRVICAGGNGISVFDKKTGKFTIINAIAGLSNPVCASVTSVNDVVWIGSEAGLLNYDLDTHRSETAGHSAALSNIYTTSQFARIGNDMVIGFRNGYAYFTPGLKEVSAPSDPVIEDVVVNNRPVLHQGLTAGDNTPLVFDHAHNSITIAFTAFLYDDAEHIKFRYRLEGADSRWQYAQGQRTANYAQLAPGDYKFYVQCGNQNGVWNGHMAALSFVVQPPYQDTWWFRALVVLAIILFFYGLYRYRLKNILAIERIRERIASDFHDDIGAALSSISIFSEVADTQLEERMPHEQTREIISHISHQSNAMLDAMDDIIWTVNPQNDHFNDLAVRMREFAIPLLEARNIEFEINIQEEIMSLRLKMETRKNIFLIYKECINNILKHAGCTAMKVIVTRLNNQVTLTVSDNGKGFDVNAPNTRNGLRNMMKRADEINGEIEIKSRQGEGTITRLVVDIT